MVKPKTKISQQELIEQHIKHVKQMAKKLIYRFAISDDLREELLSAGYVGLVEAAGKYDFDSTVPFKNFAFLRIRGAMIDAMRRSGSLSRTAYKVAKGLRAASDISEEELLAKSSKNRNPKTMIDVLDRLAQGAVVFRLSMEEAGPGVNSSAASLPSPEEATLFSETGNRIRDIMKNLLTEDERIVIDEYYFQDKQFTEISDRYPRLSKSWISRLHKRALNRIKKELVLTE